MQIWHDDNIMQEYKTFRLNFLKERAAEHSKKMKQLIKEGKFTPHITNSWANSRCKLKVLGFDKLYRSSWDAAFQILNPNCQYEKLRIEYSVGNKTRIYIVDFIDTENKIIYEIKPNACKDNSINILKEEAALNWCKQNNYKYESINDEYFLKNAKKINFKKYDAKIRRGMQQFL